jgi:hypothetical protein
MLNSRLGYQYIDSELLTTNYTKYNAVRQRDDV